MNTKTIHCPQGSQRCPSPWACGEGCNFNNEVVPKQSAQERAAAKFWEPDLPVQFVGPEPDEAVQGYPFELLDAPGNFWDSLKWWQKLGFSCVLVAVLWLVAAVVFGK